MRTRLLKRLRRRARRDIVVRFINYTWCICDYTESHPTIYKSSYPFRAAADIVADMYRREWIERKAMVLRLDKKKKATLKDLKRVYDAL